MEIKELTNHIVGIKELTNLVVSKHWCKNYRDCCSLFFPMEYICLFIRKGGLGELKEKHATLLHYM